LSGAVSDGAVSGGIVSVATISDDAVSAGIISTGTVADNAGSLRMKLLISLSALLLSIILVQMGIGSLRPFDTISGQALGFTAIEIGIIASGHFAGFLLGCIFSPSLVKRAGHSRAFAVMAGIAVISIIAHPLYPNAWFWAFIRIFAGFSVAGCYTLIESWLQAKATNEIRGRVFSLYRVVDLSGQLLANALIATLTAGSFVAYNIIAIIMCLSILPLALTQSREPALPEQLSYQPFVAFRVSPLASLGVAVAGLSTATFGSVGPLFASAVGLSISQIALFLVVSIIGGIISQIPSGMLADRLPRRVILMTFSIMATIISLLLTTDLVYLDIAVGITEVPVVFILSFLFGFSTFPIYSICAAHASDFVRESEMLALSASLIFIYAAGAIISPLIAGLLIEKIAAWAMFTFISAAHFLLMLYTIYRNFIGRTSLFTRAYAYVPRTSLFIATIIRGRRGRTRSSGPSDHPSDYPN
jgi:MFS family permease